MAAPSSYDTLVQLFDFTKKSDLERYARNLVIRGDDFAMLILKCEIEGVPFKHAISCKDIVPKHLDPSDDEIAALKNTPAGQYLARAALKAVTKMGQMFEERRYLVGHMFIGADESRWHFFCFDQRDTDQDRPNHWKEGAHVHFVNWLWPKLSAETVWSAFTDQDQRPGGTIHLRFTNR